MSTNLHTNLNFPILSFAALLDITNPPQQHSKMSQDEATQAELLLFKARTLGNSSTTAEIHAWIRAWHSLHLVTIPPSAGENLNQVFWDGQYIFGYAFEKDLQADLYRWGFDEGRTLAILHDLYKGKPKPPPTAFEIEKVSEPKMTLRQER